MNKSLLVVYALALSLMVSGCASLTGSSNQSVSLETHEQTGEEVVGASCELANNKGKWLVSTPGSVSIHRSNDDLRVLCNKDSFDSAQSAVVSDTKSSMLGNILMPGGVIGAIIDHGTGSAYEYPTLIQIFMVRQSKSETH